MTILASQLDMLRRLQAKEITGTVVAVRGMTVLADDLPLPVGSLLRIEKNDGAVSGSARTGASGESLPAEVVGFDGARSIIMLLGHSGGIAPGMRVVGEQSAQVIQVGPSMLGRVIDGLGRPIDGRPLGTDTIAMPLNAPPPSALQRRRIDEPLATGVRSIDGFLTIGKGQRIGIFSGPGVGKSTLLAMIARNTSADVNVIALVGERGREVRDFIEDSLGEEGLARSVVVVATGDESPLLRIRAALAACSVAEHFRDAGADVLFMMDSVTRFAQAQRQIGLAVGEQPATRGYTPSVFAMLPTLLERSGAVENSGSITGVYSVLVEGDDLTEPISDAALGVLDGHIVLSRKLATRNHYPAVDVLASVSRVADEVCDRFHRDARRQLIELMAAYAESEELINIGAYARGTDPKCDVAIMMKDQMDAFLRQPRDEFAEFPSTCRSIQELSGLADECRTRRDATIDSSTRAGRA